MTSGSFSWSTPPSSGVVSGSWISTTPLSSTDPELADKDDSTKLRTLADWFDVTQTSEDNEVQEDLRRIAERLEEYVGPTERLEAALRLLYEEVLSQPLVFDDRGDAAVAEAVETLAAWLSDTER